MPELDTKPQAAFSIGASTVTIMMDGDVHMLDDTDKRFVKIKSLLQENPPNITEALKALDLKTQIKKTSAGRVEISEKGVKFEGKPVHGYMVERLVAMAGAGMDVKPWMMFMDNLEENPQPDLREDLFRWMEKGKLPITDDGCIVAFKKVREDYKDVHSGTFDNSVGAVVSMPREQCDQDRHRTCSTGLHFCSADYLSQFGGERVMVVKIDPRDVTAIPSDYNDSKGRCCRYEVTGELSSQSAARHKVFDEPVMPVDPQEIPDLMAKKTPGTTRATTPGPKSPIGTKGSSRKVAANASTAKRQGLTPPATVQKTPKPTTKKTSSTKAPAKKTATKSTTAKSKVTKAVSKATKKVSKVAKAAQEVLADAVAAVVPEVASAPKKAPAKKSTRATKVTTPSTVKKSAGPGKTPKATAPKTSKVAGKSAPKPATAKKAPAKRTRPSKK